MAQYKVVPVSKTISIGHDGSQQEALKQFQNEIEEGASGGWELVCSHKIDVWQDPEPLGCLGGILAAFGAIQKPEGRLRSIDLLIFVKK